MPMIPVRKTSVIKLKDRPGRGGVKFNLLRDFGFIPQEIIIQKVWGRNNAIVVAAILTKEQLAVEKAAKKDETGRQKKEKKG